MPKFVIEGKYVDRSVTVPANTTFTAGTLLGEITASGNLAQSLSTNSDGSQAPVYALAQDLVNATGAAITYSNVRVLADGVVDGNQLVFGGTDTLSTIITGKGSVFTLLKNAGILVYKVPSIVG